MSSIILFSTASQGGSELGMRGHSSNQHNHECDGNQSEHFTPWALCGGVWSWKFLKTYHGFSYCILAKFNCLNFLSGTQLLEAILPRQSILLHSRKWWTLQRWWSQNLMTMITRSLALVASRQVVMRPNLFFSEQIPFR